MARNSQEEWIFANQYPWMTPEQRECFEMLCDLCGGAHHIGGKIHSSRKDGIYINLTYGFHASTFDYSGLTTAVVLAHDRCIRFEIKPSGPNMLKLVLSKRHQRSGEWNLMHPEMEVAVAGVRERFPKSSQEPLLNT